MSKVLNTFSRMAMVFILILQVFTPSVFAASEVVDYLDENKSQIENIEATNESTSESTNESTSEATNESTSEATNESTSEATNESTSEATSESTSETVLSEQGSQTVTEDEAIPVPKPGEVMKVTSDMTKGITDTEAQSAKFISSCSLNSKQGYLLSEEGTLEQVETGAETRTFSNAQIDKKVIDESISDDGVWQAGETVTYGVCIDNPSLILESKKIIFRDSLIENLPPQFSFEGWTGYTNMLWNWIVSGDLQNSGIKVGHILPQQWLYFEYNVRYNGGLTNSTRIENKVTWNGDSPSSQSCNPSSGYKQYSDCAVMTVGDSGSGYGGTPFISKEIINESQSADGKWSPGEEVTYKVSIRNINSSENAYNVHVRDSILESLPTGVQLVSGPTVNSPSTTSGSLLNGTFVISSLGVVGGSSYEATITYTLKYTGGLATGTEVKNVADVDGTNPAGYQSTCVPSGGFGSPYICESIVIDNGGGTTDGTTQIKKDIVSQSITNDNNLELNETASYVIEITNKSGGTASNIRVRDNLVSNTPAGIEITMSDMSPPSVSYTGSLENDNLVITSLAPGETATIAYTAKYTGGLSNGYRLTNIATDDGTDPSSISTCNPSNSYQVDIDCEEISIMNDSYTNIEKSVTDRGNEVAERSEYLYYTVDYSSSESGEILFTDIPDTGLIDISQTKLISVTEDGVTLPASEYAGSVNKYDTYFKLKNAKPGSDYQIKYYTKVLDSPENSSTLENTVSVLGQNKTATASIPTDFTVKNRFVKSVSDESDNGYAQPGEKLQYTLEFISAQNAPSLMLEDKIVNPNLRAKYSNFRVLEDGKVLDESRYMADQATGIVIITDIKAESKYTVIFDCFVNEELNSATEINNTATYRTFNDVNSDSVSIPISSTPLTEKAVLNTTVAESRTSGASNNDGKAQAGEFLSYNISFTSDLARSREFIIDFDRNLDVTSLRNLKVKVNGVTLGTDDFAASSSVENSIGVIQYLNKDGNELININFEIQVKDVLENEEATKIETTILENTSKLQETTSIELESIINIPEPEKLNLEVLNSTIVTAGSDIHYRATIDSLITEVEQLQVKGTFNSSYLSFKQVDNVYLNGSSLSTSAWSSNSSTNLDVTIDHNLPVGSKVEIEFTLALDESAPVNSNFGVEARGISGEYPTTNDVAYITTGTSDVSNAPNIMSNLIIAAEAGGSVSNQIESGEHITYQLSLENLEETDVTVTVIDTLLAQKMDTVFDWYGDDVVEVISSMSELEEDYTMEQLQTGLTLSLKPGETKLVRFTLTGKDVIGELDINPADGDPDADILNSMQISVMGKTPIHVGEKISMPYMNGELTIGKRASTSDGDNVINIDGSESINYTITVVNRGTRLAQGVFVSDQLDEQQFELIADLSGASDIPLTMEGNGEFVEANPTVADLMAPEGVEIKIPAGDYASVKFSIPTHEFDPEEIDLDADDVADGKIINKASAYDSTNKTTYPEEASLYFSSPVLDGVKYQYTNELGDDFPLIEGFDMENIISVTLQENVENLSGYISYDNRYLNDVRTDNMVVRINGIITQVDPNVEYIKQGNTTTATFTLNEVLLAGDEIEITVYQTPKDALYENTSLRYSVNNARLFVPEEKSDVYMDSYALV